MTEGIDWIAVAGKRAKGKRPEYFENQATERLMSVVMSLVAELSVTRQRLDTVERLLEKSGVLDRNAIEVYAPDRAAAQARGVETKAYIARVMRGVQQSMEAMAANDKPVEEVSRDLWEM